MYNMRSIYERQETPEWIEEIDTQYSVLLDDVEWTGLFIQTSRQVMLFLIDNFQSCCEEYDVYFENLFDIDLKGSVIDDIKWIEDISDDWLSSIKLELFTDRGNACIHMYNKHNGYYPHSYKIITADFKNTGQL